MWYVSLIALVRQQSWTGSNSIIQALGFTDGVPMIREQTIKGILLLVPLVSCHLHLLLPVLTAVNIMRSFSCLIGS